MPILKTTYKSDYVRPKIHHFKSVQKLKRKTVKFDTTVLDIDAERARKCLAKKYVKIPEAIDLYPFIKLFSYDKLLCCPEKTTYQVEFPDSNPIVSNRHVRDSECEQNTDPCRFLYDPNRYPRLASDVTKSINSTKRMIKCRYPRVYTDVTQGKSGEKKIGHKRIPRSTHIFDRTKVSNISDALPGGKCTALATEYQDGIGTFRGVYTETKPEHHFIPTNTRICTNVCDD